MSHFSFYCQITLKECNKALKRGYFTCENIHTYDVFEENIVDIHHSTYLLVRAAAFYLEKG